MTSPQDPADPKSTNVTPAAEPDAAKSAAPEQAAAPAERPRPAFGEYAPEGWKWEPPSEANAATPGQDPANAGSAAAPVEIPAPQYGAIVPGAAQHTPGAAKPASSPSLTGVPHNLGVGQLRSGSPQHFEAPAAVSVGQGAQAPAAPQGVPVAGPVKNRVGDRVVTILLLAVGAMGALNFASGFMSLPQSFGIVAEAFKMTDWVAPASIATIGIVGVFVILGIYACTLILSVQRMRRGKLAFFIPLIGGAVAFIAMFVIISIAMSQAPDLFANMTPERLQQLMDSLQMPVK